MAVRDNSPAPKRALKAQSKAGVVKSNPTPKFEGLKKGTTIRDRSLISADITSAMCRKYYGVSADTYRARLCSTGVKARKTRI